MSAPASDPVDAWIAARWTVLCGAAALAPPGWRAWARGELVADPVGASLQRRLGWSPARDAVEDQGEYDAVRDPKAREALGQVFTPPALARLLVQISGVGREEAQWPSALVLDPACGAGSLLVEAARARHGAGWSVAHTLATLEGWDRDPRAAWACRAALVSWALQVRREGDDVPGELRVRGALDALSEDGAAGDLLARRAPYEAGVGQVLTNPPYLEAKRMARAEPGLRDRLRVAFPQLHGAFDLYLAFCWRALEQAGEGGGATLLLPNKVLQGRYARRFRAQVGVTDLVDLSRLLPRPFPGTSVYPVMIRVTRRPAAEMRVRHVITASDLERSEHTTTIRTDELGHVGGEHPLFVPFETWPLLAPLFDLPRLRGVARVASTCSFHKKGLRERFVTPEPPDEHAHPYLGGPSRTRRTEVSCLRTRWSKWWIRFDDQQLREEWGNPLPDLERTFLRPKAIFCQHGLRMRVVADPAGRYVTKDVYPVAWPTHPDWTLSRLVAVLNSTVFTALYNTVYQGILVGGETYHYLPTFLENVPVPDPRHPALAGVDEAVERLHGEGEVDLALWGEVDRAVTAAYGLDEGARKQLIAVHLTRVGALAPH